MRYTNNNGQVKTFTPVDDWRSPAGYWADQSGQPHNLTETVAKSGGMLIPESKQERKIMSIALNYAVKRRERTLKRLNAEIDNLNRVLESFGNTAH